MSVSYLEYRLQNGYIHNWLVAGPQALFVADLDRFEGDDFKLRIARHYHEREHGLAQTPAERDTLSIGDATLAWRYVRCLDDHFVDLTAFYHTCHYLRAWAYALVVCPAAQDVTCVLTTNGPADVWVNGQHVHRQEHFHHQLPHSISFRATLQEGRNEILVRCEEVAVRECPYAMALRIVEHASEATPVLLPTLAAYMGRRGLLEHVFQAAYLDRDVYARHDEVIVRWPEELREACDLTLRLQKPTGQIYMEAWPRAQAGATMKLAKGFQVPSGPFRILVMPRPEEYYTHNIRVTREIPLWVEQNAYSQAPYGTYDQRRREALEDAAEREGNIFREIARMELGRWSEVSRERIAEAIKGINQRADCSDFYMVGLLGMLYRYTDDPSFPHELDGALEECVLNFKYWMDEPGSDAMCYWSENHQILFHTCQVLAGQLYPERTFTNLGKLGAWHREIGQQRALSWLRKRAGGGFREFDSNCYFEHDILALSHLADLADDDQVREFAAIVLDKLLFTMALNSYQGAFGSAHGRTYTPMIKGARLETTAGAGRLLWGMGIFNQHILGSVSLACAQSYELPPIIADIAAHQPDEVWSRERHAGVLEEWCDRDSGAWEVNKVTYKTPDYMLCSAQDYRPGTPGYQQHVWQATMGPDAVVFVTHPPCLSEEGSHRPNFWHGNVVLPRVAQWKDVLIAVHDLGEDDWLGFTHAYFPLYAFDEHALRDGFAFVRKGDGYLALTAARGLALTTQGDNAYRELRSAGRHNIWLCHMGRAAQDGDFKQFQRAVLGLEVRFEGLSVRCTTLRGETLAFGWEGPLTVHGDEVPLGGFKHYESQYCEAELPAGQMDIRLGDELMRLNFA